MKRLASEAMAAMTPMKNKGLGSLLSVTSSRNYCLRKDLERPSVSSVGRKVKQDHSRVEEVNDCWKDSEVDLG